ncbi:MAG TPA: hypothetical protein VF173_27195 [Thermoanaerobaculia bacterium]|nr:hypothetical protein [Thermoanaerobaculia bacterium]
MEKRKLRSRAYPSVPLTEAVELLRTLTEALGYDLQDRGAIAGVWGYGNSGIAARKTAALVHFGLLALRDGLYYPTELAKQILEDGDESALHASLKEAFLSPALFREIVLRYESVGRVPQDLAEVLTLDHGIQENARDEVVQIFLDSAIHARVLESDGCFSDEYFEKTGRPRPLVRLEPAPSPLPLGDGTPGEDPANQQEQILEFRVTEGKWVKIHLPDRLNESDLRLIRLQMEFLEAQVSINRPAQPVRLGLLRKESQT